MTTDRIITRIGYGQSAEKEEVFDSVFRSLIKHVQSREA